MISDPKHNPRDSWIYSRFSVGWRCGLHADYTELSRCIHGDLAKTVGIEKTRQLNLRWLVTLRHPVNRFISEWQHISRQGASWTDSTLRCGRPASPNNEPKYYQWGQKHFKTTCAFNYKKKLSFNEFVRCPHNLASNRQVRMLAELDKDGHCYKYIFPIDLNNKQYHYARGWSNGSIMILYNCMHLLKT